MKVPPCNLKSEVKKQTKMCLLFSVKIKVSLNYGCDETKQTKHCLLPVKEKEKCIFNVLRFYLRRRRYKEMIQRKGKQRGQATNGIDSSTINVNKCNVFHVATKHSLYDVTTFFQKT